MQFNSTRLVLYCPCFGFIIGVGTGIKFRMLTREYKCTECRPAMESESFNQVCVVFYSVVFPNLATLLDCELVRPALVPVAQAHGYKVVFATPKIK